MKANKIFVALAMGCAIVACAPKAQTTENGEAVKTAKDYEPSKAQLDSVSYLVGINFGSFIKGYDFGELNMSEIKKGMLDFINSKGNMRDPEFGKQFKIAPEAMNDLFNKFLEARRNQKLLLNKEAGEKFLAENGKKDGVQTTESGLQYKILEPGNDVKAGPKDTVYVHYKGTTLDGNVFDENMDAPEALALPLSNVIPGWTEGLQLIGEGGKAILYIPANLAYGEMGTQGIEPNSTLIFNVEVSKVGKAPVEEVVAEPVKK